MATTPVVLPGESGGAWPGYSKESDRTERLSLSQRVNQFSKKTMHNFSGHKEDQENPFFQ